MSIKKYKKNQLCVFYLCSQWVADDENNDDELDVNVRHLDVIKGKKEVFFLYLPFSLLQLPLVKQLP